MKSLMKLFVACASVCGFAAVGSAADWTYDASTGRITEVVTDGATSWVLATPKVSDGLMLGNNSSSYGNAIVTAGTHPIIDLTGTISDGAGTTYTITEIGQQAFRARTNFTGIKLTDTLRAIGSGAFFSCNKLVTFEPSFSETLTSIGSSAFTGASSLSCDIVFSNSGLAMGANTAWNAGTFYQNAIKSLDMSKTELSSLPMQAFRECKQLEWVKLPKNMKTFSATFYNCSKLADIAFYSLPDAPGGDVFSGSVAMPKGRVTYPAALGEQWGAWARSISGFVAWENAGNNTNTYLSTFPDGTTPIGYASIGGCVKWVVPIVEQVTDCKLGVYGNPAPIGAVEPTYRDPETVTADETVCTAPADAVFGDFVYRCVGYRTGRLVEGVPMWDDPVSGLSYTFVRQEAGEYYLEWIWEKVACKVSIFDTPESLGSVMIDTPAYNGHSGYYPFGTPVTITALPVDGVTFGCWYSGVPEDQAKANPLVLTLTNPIAIDVYFRKQWSFTDANKNKLTDGYWTMNYANGAPSSPTTSGTMRILDLEKGIDDGSAFTSLGKTWMSSSGATELWLPETIKVIPSEMARSSTLIEAVRLPSALESIETAAFYGCTNLRKVEPFLPTTLTNLGWAVFKGCSALKMDLVLGSRNRALRMGVGSEYSDGTFNNSGILSADLSKLRLADLPYQCFREARNLSFVKLPPTLENFSATFHMCSALKDVWFYNFPDGLETDTSAFQYTIDYGRFVYPKGNAEWVAYLDTHTNGNFTAWDPESARAKEYLAAFPDQWRPIGYMTIDGNKRWLVPHNFNVGTMVLVR